MKRKIITSIVSLITLYICGCAKFTIDTTYNITCTEISDSTEVEIVSSDIIGYGFYADTTYYAPESYTQAAEGKMSGRIVAGEISSDFKAVFDDSTGTISFLNLTKEGLIILVLCDQLNSIYSYRQFEVVASLPEINTSLTFYVNTFAADSSSVVTTQSWIQKK
ncbi:MAG: hypothetical protein R3Y04_06610 [Rikenellaceae bacterium]